MSTGFKFEKLKSSVEWSIKQLETPRRNRLNAIKQYVGKHYSDSGADFRNPTNFIELAMTIYTRQLAARAPKAMITAKQQALRPYAKNMELAINQIPAEINFSSTLQRSVAEAMLCYAVVKVGISPSGGTVLGHDPGKIFADLISIDDHFIDMTAKSRDKIQYEGNDYWLPLDEAKALCENDAIAKMLEADPHTIVGTNGEERAEGITQNSGGDIYEESILCRDVWLPGTRQMVTYGVTSGERMRTVDWDGPEHGPYHTLGFSDVPGNVLPLPPVAMWIDLHELANTIFRKLGRQAEAKKTVAAFQGGNDEDVNALKAAVDGEGIRYNGSKPEAITVGGIDAPTLAFYIQTKDLFTYFAGNLDALGGLGAMSDTVGQDKMMSEAASTRLNHMAERTIDFAKSIFKSLAWYEWTNPVSERMIQKEIKGANIVLERRWSRETMKGDFIDYNFDIDVYSMQDDSPSTKMQKLGTALERFVFPMMEPMMQQGARINFKGLIDTIAHLGNIPELADLVEFAEPPDEGAPSGDPKARHEKTLPNNTHRTYERINRPGATRHGKDDVMSRLLMGGGAQDSEIAAIGRSA